MQYQLKYGARQRALFINKSILTRRYAPGTLLRDVRPQGGFTLIELLVTVAIIGILAVISVPLYLGQQSKAARSEAVSNLGALRLILEQNFADRGFYCPDPANPLVGADRAVVGTLAVQGVWPKFIPGTEPDLKYTYEITCPAIATPGRPAPPGNGRSFVAFARPKAGTVVAKPAGDRTGDVWINDRNESNF